MGQPFQWGVFFLCKLGSFKKNGAAVPNEEGLLASHREAAPFTSSSLLMSLDTPSSPAPVGLIGLGLMGGALAARLREGGFEVCGHDPDPRCAAAFEAMDGTLALDAGAVLAACDIVLLSLPNHGQVKEVLAAHGGRWRPGQIILDTSTGEPQAAVEQARALLSHGVIYLDATISGSSAQVRTGEVLWMVGGDRAAFMRCADLFRCVGQGAVHTGEAGSGAKMKLVTNLVLGLNRAALAEGLAFARQLDLDPAEALDVMRRSMAYSRIMDTKGEKMVAHDFTPQAKLSQHLKDVRLMLSSAARPLPMTEAHARLLEEAVARGYGDLDNSALIKVIEDCQT